jgi:hypothetical protein
MQSDHTGQPKLCHIMCFLGRCCCWDFSRAKATGVLEPIEAQAVLRKLLYLSSRGDDKALTQTASTAFLFVLRHSPPAEACQVRYWSFAHYFSQILIENSEH